MSLAIISLSPERGANGKISLIGKFRYSSAGPARKLFAIWPATRKDFDGAYPNVVARSNPVAPVACDRLAACRRLGTASVARCIWTSRYPQVLALLDGPVAAWFNCRGLQATKQNKPAPAQTEISVNCDRHHGTIRLGSQYRAMGGDSLTPKHSCPSCGRPMGLTRTVPASPGYSELCTYGCRECGVWVTEGRTTRDRFEDRFILPK